MIRQRFRVEKLDWRVYVYYAVDCYFADEILRRLADIGCTGEMLDRAEKNLRACKMDTGVTYSNPLYRSTVMVIGLAGDKRQFFNSFIHELRHLVDDLGNMNGIELDGEGIAYLSGYLAEKMFDNVKLMLCDCGGCHEERDRKAHVGWR